MEVFLSAPTHPGVWLVIVLDQGRIDKTNLQLVYTGLDAEDQTLYVTKYHGPNSPVGLIGTSTISPILNYNKPEYRWLLLTEASDGRVADGMGILETGKTT